VGSSNGPVVLVFANSYIEGRCRVEREI
jgi:hypothetical protein